MQGIFRYSVSESLEWGIGFLGCVEQKPERKAKALCWIMFYYFVVNAVLGLQPAMGYAKEQFGVRVEVGTWISAEHPYQHFEEPPLFCFADHFHFYVAEILPSPNLCLHWYVSLLGLATGGSQMGSVCFVLFVCFLFCFSLPIWTFWGLYSTALICHCFVPWKMVASQPTVVCFH